jgi:hypothetical protein
MGITKVSQHTLNSPNGRQAVVSFVPELNVIVTHWIEKDGTKTPHGLDFTDRGTATLRYLHALARFTSHEEHGALIAWFEKELQEAE